MASYRADQRTISHVQRVGHTLASPVRVAILLHLLRNRSGLIASELAQLVGVHPATLSHQLTRLEAAGVIEGVREGTCIRYRIARTRIANDVRRMLRLLCGS